ncbi:UDP-N-acetylmuramoylalanyl-D-glutamate--2,6-diaminopimelate ligase [Curtobacterium sp. MCBA15_007]|uniref:UDP-N-acetylmuramoyl-tripeptide--D-alanyl-D-alanine ligase n=1 Tax=Curtobacterium flaccumfaciens pv. flaccumfaciens TaxID=138532 RepID=A0A9Q2W3D2_9MICO|nr:MULTISPECIES: UDP-N-acetylmuramoyl-tripeptide--D-alanyl-D-alanine ligase [Curtobacterium]EYT62265.1 UDP-N-acetylmuramoylalanyl-D-glutamate--2,6-diaminopimelate ligase [Curtobacterium flaccumfaciens UCD-AKU]MBT1542126.1 UDP-N-acetylmuramoyl-tripeptide--D-alanyl-D-alanine ligase [Curtobacterium flaccumfaciens pv. flaccumfaciens]MCS6565047.1 UDP-N-acetylmuramoyl-tripeptide--D-alanyl-D-alanine ligase [Curtobacterium flaccumfaciens pv. flaccumfaciens]OII06706.1 UDP-N-acetylmuramoylalanyl-D-glutam
MIAMTLAEIATAVSGELIGGAQATDVAEPGDLVVEGSVETDSRLVRPGSVFFALPGEVTDGRRFVPAAVDAGAALVITPERVDTTAPQIVVTDGYEALAALAHEVVTRVRMSTADRVDADGRPAPLRVVGITGSNGKTSTKNMLRTILEQHGATIAPEGSFNNHVGAPISMLRVTYDTRYLVVEMGASGVGHIAKLVSIAEPDLGVVLKVGLAHAGEFGGIEATQRAKSEMVTDLPETATALLNVDDDRVASMRDLTAARVVGFGTSAEADYRITGIETDRSGTRFTLTVPPVRPEGDRPTDATLSGGPDHVDVRLAILGEHHAMNASAALTVAHLWGVPLADGAAALASMTRAERWRMELLQGGPEGVTVINDAYNASPDSTAAALRTLAQIVRPGERTVAVLGEMAELGEFSVEEHDRIGRLVVRLGIGQLVVVGRGAMPIHQAATLEGSWDGESVYIEDVDDAVRAMQEMLRPGDVVLVKSSKSAELRFLGDRLGGVTE